MSCSMKTLIATCSASYANAPLVSPVCPSNDNYVPTPMPISDELVIGPGKGSSHVLILVDRSEQQGEVWCSVTELL